MCLIIKLANKNNTYYAWNLVFLHTQKPKRLEEAIKLEVNTSYLGYEDQGCKSNPEKERKQEGAESNETEKNRVERIKRGDTGSLKIHEIQAD